jgi:hypothetical protein
MMTTVVAVAAFVGGWYAGTKHWHKKVWAWAKTKWENRK